ncbi:MAG: S-layer homology domain-containing protein [Clostridiaceae bacterium]|nr:S-layer homology domain-containing protein [Clostridiaceae bacterium]
MADGDTFDENDAWTQDDSFSITPNFKGWVYARSVYAGGTTSDYTIKALVVDNTKPTISANYNASAGSITVTVTDSGAGIEAITYQVGSDPLQTIDLEPTTAQPNLTTEHEFTISGLPDGQYDVVIDATDNSGNTANTETVPVDRGGSTVTDATINPTGGDFDLYAPDDVETTITWNDAGSVTDVRAGGTSIGAGSYSVNDIDGSTATLTINQAYLETKPVGSLTLTIVFDQGASATLTIDISDSTPAPVIDATISPESVIYDLAAPGNVSTTITLHSAESVTGVVYGTTPLSTPDAYVVSGSALTIKSNYIDSLGLSDGDTAEFEISFDVGNSATLTVHIENNPALSDNADLSDLTVGGSTVTGFDPSDEEYDVELPYNTLPGSAAALVGATADNAFASVDITQASSFPGSATVEVTAQDGTPKTYTIHFTLAAAPNVPVESITVTGVGGATSVEVGGTLQMLAAVSPGNATNQDVDWSIEGGSGSAAISTSGLLTANATGTVTVRATAQDGSGEYDDKVITITNAAPTGKTLLSITAPNDPPDVVNGVPKTAAALGLPSTVTLVTDSGNVSANVTWNVAASSYNPSTTSVQTFTVGGTVALPSGVINPTGIDLSVTIRVTVSAAQPSNGNGNGGGGGGSSSSGTKVTIQPDKKPDQPVIAGFSATPALDGNGHATATIPQQSVADAIAKAQADAKAQGNTANGIGVSLETQNPAGTNSLGIVLTQPTLELLTDSMVRQFEVDGGLLTLDFNLEALKQIRAQSTGDVTISLTPVTEISDEAKTLVGTRAVYNITLSYIRDDKTVNITSLNNGSVTLSIPYTPGQNEAVGYLFGVYIDGNGQATRIPGSTYDANSGGIILDSSHFSVYGVGYTAPSAKFTDISTHWAKESIDYAVGRGLFSGTTETTFSPDTAMSRGMLVTVLGRLAGADVSGYKTSSFTDVKAGSTFQPYIEWAYKKGVIQGTGNGKFEPDRAVTREEIAVIFANYAKATGYTLPVTREVVTFTDGSSIGSSAKDAVKVMQQAGIMSGKNNGYFDPKGSATRAEVATMLQRYIKLTINPATAQGWALNDAGQYIYYKNAKVLTGWQTIDGVRYYFYSTGILQTGWVKDGNSWRYYSGNKALIGWWNIGSGEAKKIYYFTTDGIMVSGKWLQIDGKWYYFYADGALAVSTKIDGYEVDENGTRKTQ